VFEGVSMEMSIYLDYSSVIIVGPELYVDESSMIYF
jgi:hypothetical protein